MIKYHDSSNTKSNNNNNDINKHDNSDNSNNNDNNNKQESETHCTFCKELFFGLLVFFSYIYNKYVHNINSLGAENVVIIFIQVVLEKWKQAVHYFVLSVKSCNGFDNWLYYLKFVMIRW